METGIRIVQLGALEGVVIMRFWLEGRLSLSRGNEQRNVKRGHVDIILAVLPCSPSVPTTKLSQTCPALALPP